MADEKNRPQVEIGMLLEVLTEENDVLFRARVTDFDGNSIRIVNDSGEDMPTVVFNTGVKLRGPQGVVFRGTVCGSSGEMWKLDQLNNLSTEERREFFRQNISVAARVSRVKTKDGAASQENKVDCKLLDVSGGGVLVGCNAIYESGDELLIGNAAILPDMESFSFRCVIRRAQKGRFTNLYGCEFLKLQPGEQDRLFKAIFLLQRQEAKRLRGGK